MSFLSGHRRHSSPVNMGWMMGSKLLKTHRQLKAIDLISASGVLPADPSYNIMILVERNFVLTIKTVNIFLSETALETRLSTFRTKRVW